MNQSASGRRGFRWTPPESRPRAGSAHPGLQVVVPASSHRVDSGAALTMTGVGPLGLVLFKVIGETGRMAWSQRSDRADGPLTGLNKTEPSQTDVRGFFALSLAASIYAWHGAFDLGAYATIFFLQRHEFFAAIMVVLLGVLIMRRRVHIRAWLLALFAVPVAAVLLQVVFPAKHVPLVVRVFYLVLITLSWVVSPLLLWVIARLLAPDYFTLPDRRAKIGIVAIVAAVALVGFLVGRYNSHFLTCGDFRVAGQHEPTNCAHGKHL